METNNILCLENIQKSFIYHDLLKKKAIPVLKNISLKIQRGRTYGLVGESGSGKSTIANIIMGIVKQDSGVCKFKNKVFFKTPTNIQMIFQDAFSSLNPKMSIKYILEESLIINHKYSSKDRKEQIHYIIEKVGISRKDLEKKPTEFSGGQCQRIALARSLILNPDLLILDESVSALDASVQAQILNLLVALQKELELSYLFLMI